MAGRGPVTKEERVRAGTPSGVERTLPHESIIVSKTDTKGRITYVNDVFVDISRYTNRELIGQPHSIIRHPHMPRGIFALAWERLLSGQEIFAFVNNLASDGANYWVLAHMTPTRENGQITGYHSNRRSPPKAAVTQMDSLYRSLLAEEAKHTKASQAATASKELLENRLTDQGMTYEEFVWKVIAETMRGGNR